MSEELKVAYSKFMLNKMYDKAFSCLYHLYGKDKGIYPLVREFRGKVNELVHNGIDMRENNKLLKKAYLLTARDKFDDFMIYIEWDRPVKEKFWLPRRSKLLTACNVLQDMEDGKMDELFLSMPPRVGKTTLMVFFMLWVILRDSERSNLYCSYTDSVVQVFS